MNASPPMPDIESLALFDSCVTLGRVVSSGCPESFPTVESVLAMMDRYRIAEALVYDHHAKVAHPRDDGNRRLLKAVEGTDRLHPAWVVEPPKEPGPQASGALVDALRAAGVRAVRFPMKVVPPLAWHWDDLCAALEDHRIPCFLDFGETSSRGSLTDSDVGGIREIALAHPDLPLILSHVMGGLGINPGIVPLVRRVPNVYIDVCGILEYWREVARDVGPERVLFATGAPFTDPGVHISAVQYARHLDENAKRLVCGDNLRRLLGAVR